MKNPVFWSWALTLPPFLANDNKYRVFFLKSSLNKYFKSWIIPFEADHFKKTNVHYDWNTTTLQLQKANSHKRPRQSCPFGSQIGINKQHMLCDEARCEIFRLDKNTANFFLSEKSEIWRQVTTNNNTLDTAACLSSSQVHPTEVPIVSSNMKYLIISDCNIDSEKWQLHLQVSKTNETL